MSKQFLVKKSSSNLNFNLAASSQNCRFCEWYDTGVKILKEISLLLGLFINLFSVFFFREGWIARSTLYL